MKKEIQNVFPFFIATILNYIFLPTVTNLNRIINYKYLTFEKSGR